MIFLVPLHAQQMDTSPLKALKTVSKRLRLLLMIMQDLLTLQIFLVAAMFTRVVSSFLDLFGMNPQQARQIRDFLQFAKVRYFEHGLIRIVIVLIDYRESSLKLTCYSNILEGLYWLVSL